MGDISTWNPVDNSNTTAPPDGWPEGMAVSGVNNCARAMMGAVRRWYDTVTAQISGMLPLTGGTLTGTLNAPYLHSTGNVVADVDLGGRACTSVLVEEPKLRRHGTGERDQDSHIERHVFRFPRL